MSKIIHVTSVDPKYKYDTDQIIESAERNWLSRIDPTLRKLALKIFKGAEIQTRRSALPLEMIFADLSFEQKNNAYIEAAIDLAQRALKKALDESGIDPKEIDYLITTSCTGFMIPSVDSYLVDALGLRKDVIRMPITEMGCAGGTAALTYAAHILKSQPTKKAAIIAVEVPSITFQKNDLSMENLVSTAIFADGASCVIMGETDKLCPRVIDTDMYHFANTSKLMGYHLQNSGLKIILDKEVPDQIQDHFPKFFFPFLERNKLSVESIRNYLFHPGGKKIINRMEDFIGKYRKDISDSKEILKTRGNMSSATILHILEKFMSKPNIKGDLGYMLAFGPGFSAQSLLLRWE